MRRVCHCSRIYWAVRVSIKCCAGWVSEVYPWERNFGFLGDDVVRLSWAGKVIREVGGRSMGRHAGLQGW